MSNVDRKFAVWRLVLERATQAQTDSRRNLVTCQVIWEVVVLTREGDDNFIVLHTCTALCSFAWAGYGANRGCCKITAGTC